MRRPAIILLTCAALTPALPQDAPPEAAEHPGEEHYHTPRAGEGFETVVFGRPVTVPARDRRSVSAWDLGLTAVVPGVAQNEILPFGSLYFWRHPDENSLFRAVVVGVYDEVLYTRTTESLRPFEGVFTLENRTVPFEDAEIVDGKRIEEEELFWGYVRPAIGIGHRTQLERPGHNDNMLALALLAEPGFFYADGGHDTVSEFIESQDTFEMRGRLQLRCDALERNLLELPHGGFALGADLIYGYRADWEDWGLNGREDASRTRDYARFAGYALGAAGVPFVESERHRLIGSLHGGSGDDLDRFSSFRIGGGPQGEEYEAIARPVLPGAAIEEFTTCHYAILLGEYRWEPIFFAYLSLRASVAYLDRERFEGDKTSTRSDDVLASIGARITTGFLFETRLQLDYNYNAGVLRRGEYGGHEVTMHISASF